MSPILHKASSLEAITNALHVGLIVLDEQARVVLWNHWMDTHSGIAADNALGHTLWDIFPNEEHGRLSDSIKYAIGNCLPSVISPALQHQPILPLYQRGADKAEDRRMEVLMHIVPLVLETAERGCLIQVSDMTAAVMRERLLRQQADALRRAKESDILSGLSNRMSFDRALAQEARRLASEDGSLGMIMIEIDDYRRLVDTQGKAEGDTCISHLGQLLRDSLPGPEAIAARYGNDQFVILLPDADEAAICLLADTLCTSAVGLEIPHPQSDTSPYVTISLGACVIRASSGHDTTTLVSGAEIALYQAKSEGRNRGVLFDLRDDAFHACSDPGL